MLGGWVAQVADISANEFEWQWRGVDLHVVGDEIVYDLGTGSHEGKSAVRRDHGTVEPEGISFLGKKTAEKCFRRNGQRDLSSMQGDRRPAARSLTSSRRY